MTTTDTRDEALSDGCNLGSLLGGAGYSSSTAAANALDGRDHVAAKHAPIQALLEITTRRPNHALIGPAIAKAGADPASEVLRRRRGREHRTPVAAIENLGNAADLRSDHGQPVGRRLAEHHAETLSPRWHDDEARLLE